MEETDLTRQDGEPTPRADVQFVKVSLRTPLGFRFDAESRTSAHSAGDRAAALMLLIVAGTVSSGTLAGLVLLVGGPGWAAVALGVSGVVLVAIAGRQALAQRKVPGDTPQDDAPQDSAPRDARTDED
ncbi:hypothetical protein ACRYCC_39540 [Actinomadura scrupuli]|uniref:hypothetical protein n=1 Tax=Actinomadura scrupuli TaxID=559629 RepID=UPI003D988297